MLDPNRGRSRTNGRPLVRPLSKAIGVVSVMFITLLFWLFAAQPCIGRVVLFSIAQIQNYPTFLPYGNFSARQQADLCLDFDC